jgi:tetratricopeptide (TPR) repeat protein
MVKPPKAKTTSQKKKSESGLIGGPSTIRGVTYQVDHAVYLLLDQISLALSDPFTQRSIATEPRTIVPKIIRWDIRTDPPETTSEAKFNPKREELLDWLKLVGQASVGAPERRFRFVYAEERAAARLIQTVKALSRIAIEVSGDREGFDKLVAHEEIKGADEVLSLLGEEATRILQMIDLEQLSDNTLDSDIRLRLRYLTTPEKTTDLRKYLFEKLQRAAPTRAIFPVKVIIDELREEGFTLHQPPRIDAQMLSLKVFTALSVMENCKSGLPIEVLAVVTGMTPDVLAAALAPIREAFSDNGLWSLAPLGARLAHPDEVALQARVLEEVLSYVKRHSKSPAAQDQVPNVIALAETCLQTHPRLVAKVFGDIDKLLKEMGQKHLVRDVAMLSMTAARPLARTGDSDMKLAVIRSLICGLAWYYQRVGDLEEAHVAASKSLRFAGDVGSKVDLAYSTKCTGRLRRLEAEAMEPSSERQSKLSESIGMLSRAIQYFSDAEGHGPNGAEVGDCYSLMARTHLVAGEFAAAQDSMNRAFARIPDDGGKDQIDAMILAGDIAAASKDNNEALHRYDRAVQKALSPGREVTEMRARALRQRGRIKRTIGNTVGAEADLKEAARIWGQLEEPNFAAEVEFEMLDLSVNISDVPRSLLLKEPAAVRAQVMKFHVANRAEYKLKDTKVAGRRAEPPLPYWKDLIKRAHDLVGFEVI